MQDSFWGYPFLDLGFENVCVCASGTRGERCRVANHEIYTIVQLNLLTFAIFAMIFDPQLSSVFQYFGNNCQLKFSRLLHYKRERERERYNSEGD